MAAAKHDTPKLDFYTKNGAGVLAAVITNYWKRRGYPDVRVDRYQIPHTTAYGVRSNIVNGFPPRTLTARSVMTAAHA